MKNKLNEWIKQNKKALYWPLVAISYHILSYLAMILALRIKILLYIFAFPSVPAIIFVSRSTQILDEIFYWVNNKLLVYGIYFFVFVVAFYGLGLTFSKIRNKWLKLLFILLVLATCSLYLMNLVVWTQKTQQF